MILNTCKAVLKELVKFAHELDEYVIAIEKDDADIGADLDHFVKSIRNGLIRIGQKEDIDWTASIYVYLFSVLSIRKDFLTATVIAISEIFPTPF